MGSKRKDGFIYSTDDDFFDEDDEQFQESVDPSNQHIRVQLDRKMRKGKTVTLITGFEHSDNELKDLARDLKTHCGTGGSYGEGEVIIQGDMVGKVLDFLTKRGYNVRKIGG